MKKLFYRSLCAALLASGSILAQSPLAQKQSQFNFGVGFSSWGVPFYLGMDYGIHPDISLGGELSYRSYRENWKKDY
jgi:outer membrane immunogenic protein